MRARAARSAGVSRPAGSWSPPTTRTGPRGDPRALAPLGRLRVRRAGAARGRALPRDPQPRHMEGHVSDGTTKEVGFGVGGLVTGGLSLLASLVPGEVAAWIERVGFPIALLCGIGWALVRAARWLG